MKFYNSLRELLNTDAALAALELYAMLPADANLMTNHLVFEVTEEGFIEANKDLQKRYYNFDLYIDADTYSASEDLKESVFTLLRDRAKKPLSSGLLQSVEDPISRDGLREIGEIKRYVKHITGSLHIT